MAHWVVPDKELLNCFSLFITLLLCGVLYTLVLFSSFHRCRLFLVGMLLRVWSLLQLLAVDRLPDSGIATGYTR